MKRIPTIAIAWLMLLGAAPAQEKPGRLPQPRPSLQGWLLLPLPVSDPIFNDITESVGVLDLRFQYPFALKGMGLGVGVKGGVFALQENALAPENIAGEVQRWTFYGQAQFERYAGPRSYYQLAAQVGSSQYTWDCASCDEPTRQSGLFVGGHAGFFLHATDDLAFGLLLGYERDNARLTPGQLCLDGYPGRTDTGPGAPYQYLTVGLGFSTRFIRSEEGPGW